MDRISIGYAYQTNTQNNRFRSWNFAEFQMIHSQGFLECPGFPCFILTFSKIRIESVHLS